ncbi:MAG TPA: carbon monoxide dehydrogenase subunit G [Candidatus Binatia bacterium]|nr:carbon monoxide dehydrogenase subunit G [Candidatus Binatia bacterium]
MKVEVSHVLPHPRERVWDALLDPAVLARVMPGVEKFEEVGPEKYAVAMKLGVPAVRGSYTGSVEIVDKAPPESYRLRGEGKGGPGWAKGEVLFKLVPEDSGTRVIASGQAQIGGTIAGVGQRMMEGVAKAMAREFFESIDRELQGRQQKVTAVGFGFRLVIGIVWSWIRRLFGRREATGSAGV